MVVVVKTPVPVLSMQRSALLERFTKTERRVRHSEYISYDDERKAGEARVSIEGA